MTVNSLCAAEVGSVPGVPAEEGQLGAGRHPEHPVRPGGMRGPVWARVRRGAENPQCSMPPAALRSPALRFPV